jgi:hypothetical protein
MPKLKDFYQKKKSNSGPGHLIYNSFRPDKDLVILSFASFSFLPQLFLFFYLLPALDITISQPGLERPICLLSG